MHQYCLLIPILCFVVAPAFAAGFDCSNQRTAVEKMICQDATLSRKDEMLNAVYTKAFNTTDRADELKKQQVHWLKTRRDQCRDRDCLNYVYDQRIQMLSLTLQPMSDAKAKVLCEELTHMINNGSIQNYFINDNNFQLADDITNKTWQEKYKVFEYISLFKIYTTEYKGKKKAFGYIIGGGTCSLCNLMDLDNDGTHNDNKGIGFLWDGVEEDEDLRWISWGNCDNLIFFMNEIVVVNGRFDAILPDGILISWIAPDATKRPLGILKLTGNANIRIIHDGGNKKLCQAVAADKVNFMPWSPEDNFLFTQDADMTRFPCFDRFGRHVGRRTLHIDINLDGTEEMLGLLSYDFSGGCGSEHQCLADISDQENFIVDSPLNQLLLTHERGPVGGTKDLISTPEWHKTKRIKIFLFEDKPYILGFDAERNVVVTSVWQNQEKKWCDLHILPEYEIKKMYPLAPFPMDPDA